MKTFKGKAIYNPSGKAGEYSYWACNFYKGCSNGCTYCYLKKGILKHEMGGDKPELKSCFKDEAHALEVFKKELLQNIDELREHGLFFSFTTDPMLPETISLTFDAIQICLNNSVPIKVLTKKSNWWSMWYARANMFVDKQHLVAFGFTLTGHDELEAGASTNAERIAAMKQLHKAGFKTFASIEPIIDFESSFEMINDSTGFCDLYKIGLMAGKKYDKDELRLFVEAVTIHVEFYGAKVYWKESIRKHFDVFPDAGCNVERDYNLFK